jgi:hypothetical protein
MKKFIYLSTIISLILLFQGCSEEKLTFSEVGNLTGRVVKASSFDPIENAKVTLSPTNNSVFTDADGYFLFEDVAVGDYSVTAEKEDFLAGYEPATITTETDVNIIFELEESDALNKPPFAPELLSPEDNTVDLPTEVELIWSTALDPDDDPLEYGIQIRNDYDDTLISVESLTDTTYVVSNLQFGVKYFWQVSVNDGHNSDVLTSVSTFEITSYPENRYLFVREENGFNTIFSSDETGESLALTASDKNCWRPRRNQAAGLIAFLRTENTETHIFTMKPDGTDVQQVTDAVPLVAFKQSEIDFAWSSNGDRFIYPSFDKLYLINKDGSGLQLIYQTPDGSFITECDWSYDESVIALKTNDIDGYNTSIYTIDINGNLLDTILTGVTGAAGGLNISIDNQKLLYTYDTSGYEDASYRQLDTHIFIYNFTTTNTFDLSFDKTAGTNDLDPRFTPNEARVIFVNTSNDGISEKQIFLVDLDGENREMLFENAFMPDWE